MSWSTEDLRLHIKEKYPVDSIDIEIVFFKWAFVVQKMLLSRLENGQR